MTDATTPTEEELAAAAAIDKAQELDADEPTTTATALGAWPWLSPQLLPLAERSDGPSWLSKPPPPREYLLRYLDEKDDRGEPVGVLAAGRVGFLASPGGVGKSYALCSLALAVSIADRQQRTCWLGVLEVNGDKADGKVLMLMGEEEDAEIQRRLYNSAKMMGLSDDDKAKALSRIVPVALAGHDDAALTQAATPLETKTETAFSEGLRKRLETIGPWSLVIVDPLARFAGADAEKDNAAATRFVQVLEKLTNLPGKPTVLCAHHTRKQGGAAETTEVHTDDMRGAGALKDGARFVAVLEESTRLDDAPAIVRFVVRKNNYGARPGFDLVRRSDGALEKATKAQSEQYKAAAKKKQKGDASTETTPPKKSNDEVTSKTAERYT